MLVSFLYLRRLKEIEKLFHERNEKNAAETSSALEKKGEGIVSEKSIPGDGILEARPGKIDLSLSAPSPSPPQEIHPLSRTPKKQKAKAKKLLGILEGFPKNEFSFTPQGQIIVDSTLVKGSDVRELIPFAFRVRLTSQSALCATI